MTSPLTTGGTEVALPSVEQAREWLLAGGNRKRSLEVVRRASRVLDHLHAPGVIEPRPTLLGLERLNQAESSRSSRLVPLSSFPAIR